jgi:hypothetical protein
MPLSSILAVVWLVSVPGFGTASFQQETPAASSTQSPASAPADTTQTAPTKGESPAAEQGKSDGAAKKKAEGAPREKTAKRHRVRKGARKPAPTGGPRKVVVREGGATEPPAQIVPGLTPQESDRQRQHAVQLLASTEWNLKQLAGRALDSQQQETVAQIHNYVDSARSALNDGDTQRANTLALKARLLADDLVKH